MGAGASSSYSSRKQGRWRGVRGAAAGFSSAGGERRYGRVREAEEEEEEEEEFFDHYKQWVLSLFSSLLSLFSSLQSQTRPGGTDKLAGALF